MVCSSKVGPFSSWTLPLENHASENEQNAVWHHFAKISKTFSHSLCSEFQFLPSERRLQVQKSRTCYENKFASAAITHMVKS